jgi:delta 1-pyrroline-5-carboxylate dehydrogenase
MGICAHPMRETFGLSYARIGVFEEMAKEVIHAFNRTFHRCQGGQGHSGRTADVFEPMTGEVQGKGALASEAEVGAAVKNAKAAQPEWASTNPQRRARPQKDAKRKS